MKDATEVIEGEVVAERSERSIRNSRTKSATPRSVRDPNPIEIAWAAGIFEGEGSAGRYHGYELRVSVSQKDPWILHRLQDMFGGSLRASRWKSGPGYIWRIYGQLARAFLRVVMPHLSPWRQAQARRALGEETAAWAA